MTLKTLTPGKTAAFQEHKKSALPARRRAWWPAVRPWIMPLLLLAAWQAGAQAGWIAPRLLPAPSAVLQAGVHLTRTGELPQDIAISAGRALLGFAIGGSVGFLLGLACGLWKAAEGLLDGTVQMFRTIPNLALIPLIIVWFGIGETAKVVLVALGVFFPLYLNTYHGIRTADPGLKEMGRVYGLTPWTLFRRVIFPGALPSILVGLRFALGIMWLVLIGAETLAADSGIGYLTSNAREFMQTDVVVLGVLIYALLGKSADLAAKTLEKRFLQWHPNYQLANEP